MTSTYHPDLDLNSYLDEFWLQAYQGYLPKATKLWANAVDPSRFGVDRSTIRAFHTGVRGEGGPQALYDSWAHQELQSQAWPDISNPVAFEAWHGSLAQSLSGYWKRHVAEATANRMAAGDDLAASKFQLELSVAQKFKLVDLFVKWLGLATTASGVNKKHILAFGHIPLDRKSIHVLSALFSGVTLGAEFSMGMVKSHSPYRYFQALARLVCARAGGTPILLDTFAWHAPQAQALYNAKAKSNAKAARGRSSDAAYLKPPATPSP